MQRYNIFKGRKRVRLCVRFSYYEAPILNRTEMRGGAFKGTNVYQGGGATPDTSLLGAFNNRSYEEISESSEYDKAKRGICL